MFVPLLPLLVATVDLSCQVQRTISQPVTGGRCPDNSGLRLCPSEGIMCSCFGQGLLLQWRNSLFTQLVVFTNNGPTSFAPTVDPTTGATAVATVVNPRVNLTSDLTLSVTTTATLNASQFNNTAIGCEDASGPSGAMERMIFLFGRFIHIVTVFATYMYYMYMKLILYIPYSLDQTPWLLFISLCNFVWLLFETRDRR